MRPAAQHADAGNERCSVLRTDTADSTGYHKNVADWAPDLNAAMDAANEGNIFRFLTKPCEKDVLGKAITTGLVQHRLVAAEKELLENTLMGSIKVLTDVLSAASPEAFGR